MISLFEKGGWVMYAILLGSAVGLSIFLERMWALQRHKINPPMLLRQLLQLIRLKQWSEARVLCQRESSALARLAWVMFSQLEASRDREALKDALQEAGQREAFFMERGIGSLGMVASLEPLLGLLGTVLGMIVAFQRVELGGVGDPRLVAGGVWVALLTTAAGLIVAIPAYVGYRFLLARVDRLLLDLQSDISLLMDNTLQQLEGETARSVESTKSREVAVDAAVSSAARSEIGSEGR
ncbi:MotA/TolQ/ExbB proton channel family protein [Myxococcota bacterium]|nr:MotA/TolQ/ExbB proton channel family protein [Myxococcota bacterium]